jgi:hypothetical protein
MSAVLLIPARSKTAQDVTRYTPRKCLIFLGCDGVTSSLQYDRHAASNYAR